MVKWELFFGVFGFIDFKKYKGQGLFLINFLNVFFDLQIIGVNGFRCK